MNIKHQLCLILTLTVILITPSQSATNDDFFIPDAQEITFSKNTLHSSNSNTKYISFSSFEQKFDLILQEKNQLMNGYSAKHKSIKLFTGKIKDNDQSWARITVINDKYTGAIFDGKELYMLDVGENINGALANQLRANQYEHACFGLPSPWSFPSRSDILLHAVEKTQDYVGNCCWQLGFGHR